MPPRHFARKLRSTAAFEPLEPRTLLSSTTGSLLATATTTPTAAPTSAYGVAIQTLPPAPSGLTPTLQSPTSISLAWVDNSGGTAGFVVERQAEGGLWSLFWILPMGVTSYTDATAQPSTQYGYRVSAVNSAGQSGPSNTATATTPATVGNIARETGSPPAPSGLNLVTASANSIQMSWTDNSGGTAWFVIERQTAGGAWSLLWIAPTGVTSYKDATVQPSTLYSYRVSAVSAVGTSAPSNVASATTPAAPPAAPTGLTLAMPTAESINLNWTDNSGGTAGFAVERQAAGGQWSLLWVVPMGTTSYTDTTVLPSVQYSYRVSAVNSAGRSSPSNTATIVTPLSNVPLPPPALTAPSGLNLTVQSVNSILLNWTDNSAGTAGFIIDRQTADGIWNLLMILPIGTTNYTDATVLASTQYTYRVSAYNSTDSSSPSNTATATTPAAEKMPSILPAAPSALNLTVQSANSILLDWTDNSAGTAGFIIERQTAGGVWSLLWNLPVGVTGYTDPTVLPSTQYSYRVSAVNGAGTSSVSNTATATTTSGQLTSPSGLNLTVQSSTSIQLNWTDNSSNETGFLIERQTGTGSWSTLVTTLANATSFTDATVQAGTQYSYRVSAVNGSGTSSASNTATANTSASNLLVPGTGWTGPTAPPAVQGQPGQQGYADTAIGRWDVVPFQTFTGQFNVGVIAFDIAGIDRVDFAVNGGAWTSVRQMTVNPQTGVAEYWATLRAGDFAADGAVELRAIVYPKVGLPRVLAGTTVNASGNQSVTLYADGNGTLSQQALWVATTGSDTTGNGSQANPYASILQASMAATSGATIYMQPGTYQFTGRNVGGNLNDRWITITAAPGVSRSAVIIQPDGAYLKVNRLALENVSIDCIVGNSLVGLRQWWPDSELWLDNVDISSSLGKSYTPEIGQPIDSSWTTAYVTNSSLHDYPGRAIVANDVAIVRNVQITNIGDDAVDNPQLVVNTTVDTVIGNTTGDHIDGFQWFIDHPDANSILYNIKATNVDGQLLFGGVVSTSVGVFSNVAVVNFLGTSVQGSASPAASQISGNHLLYYNLTMPNQNFLINTDYPLTLPCTDIVIAGSVLWRLYGFGPSITVMASHIIDYANESGAYRPPAGDFTTGNPGFISAPNADGTYSPTADFHLQTTSVLRNRLTVLLAPVDLDGVARTLLDSIGAYA